MSLDIPDPQKITLASAVYEQLRDVGRAFPLPSQCASVLYLFWGQ